jgi:hypothetical protein
VAAVIALREVIEALEMQSDDCVSYLDPDTGEIITATLKSETWRKKQRNLSKMFPNGSVRCCQESVPCWQAIVACSCRTASRFMNGPLWMNSHKHGIASGCGKNCWMRFMEQAPFGCFAVRFDAWA